MTAQAQAAPSAPAGFDATAAGGEVALAWDDPGDGTITGYQYQQKEGSGSFGGWIDIPDSASGGANAASYTVTGLTPGTAYTFKLRAVYDLGEGAESGEASATPAIGGAWSYETVLTPSTIAAGDGVGARMTFRAKFQADQASLTSLSVRITSRAAIWVALRGEDENIGWTTYAGPFDDSILFDSSVGALRPVSGSRCRANEAAGSIVCEARFGERFYAKSTATPGDYTVETWVYDAFTYTAVVNGLESTRSRPNNADFPDTTLTVLPAPPLPAAPAGFGATAGAGEVTLRWDDPRDFSITKYQYQQKAGSGSFGGWNDIADSGAVRGANATSYTVTGLDNGVAYTFKIRAVNSGGEGAESGEASATPGIGGAWSFAIKLEPDPITAGGTTGADVTVVATFTADQQSLLSLSATAGGNGDLTAFVPQDSATLVGFGDSFDDAIGLANFVLFEDQPDCVPDLSAGILTCTYEISDTNDQLIYAKATATPGPYTIGVSPNIETATITASVNGVTSTMATITGTTIPDVTLTVLAASNTAPSFGEGGTAARAVDENAAAGANVGGTVTATDADSTDTLTYTLSGADAGSFDIGADTGQITLGSGTTLDFESKSSYTVTVSVHDGKEAGGNADTSVDDTIAMTINVIDVDEGGSVFLSSEQPRAGTELTATLQDDDAGVTNTTWQWARSADGSTNWGDIASATSASYTPVDGDVDNYLRATATYDDTHGNGKSAQAVSVNRVLPAVPPAQLAGFDATAGIARVTLAWTDPNDPSITNYRYQQRKGSGSYGQWLDIPGSGPTTASHTVTGLTVGAGYTFRIRAVNGVGAGAESAEAGVTLAAILSGTTELWSAGLTVAESSDAAFGGYRRGGHGTLSSTTFTYESVTYTVSVLNRERETADNLLRVAFEPAIPDGLIINRLVLRVGDTYFNSGESDIATGDAPASNIAIWPTSAVAFAPGTWVVGTEVGVALYEIPLTLTLSADSTTVSEDPPDPLPNNAPTNPGQNVKVTVTVLPEPQVGVRYTGCGLRAADSSTTPYTAGTADYSIPAATKAIRDADTPTWTKSFNFWIIDDQEFDPGETLVIEAYCTGESGVTPPKAAADLLTTQLTFTITDNELVAPVVNSQPYFDDGDSTSRTIAENADAGANVGTAVAATDSEDDVLTYSISGADAGSFTIDGTNGQLKTSATLDHETKPSYTVTVSVHDGANAAGEVDTSADDTITVTINVTNVDEVGSVALNSEQPQVGTALNATLTDPDGGISDVSWQWASSSDWDATAETGTWSVTTAADSESYTPVDGDVDNYLRATASYTDPEGSGKSAQTVSVNRVQAAPVVNTAPAFPADTATRAVDENAAVGADIGAAVTATDGEDDTLTYSISGADAGSFDIGAGTGQITVRSGTSLDYESRNSYAVVVTAADPSGATDTIAVTINVTDVDEPPDVSGQTAVDYAENGAASVATYTASDPEGQTGISWTLAGDDSGDFSITEGVLSFNASPNFESAADANTDNAYLITVQASDGTVTGALEVTITVTNVEEAGVVSLSPDQPQVGTELTATLTDPDGSVSGVMWVWESSPNNSTWSVITGADSESYTPVDGDVGNYLRATASYTDPEGSGKSAQTVSVNRVQAAPVVNTAPAFPTDTATRSIAENTPVGGDIGAAVTATDADATDTLTYSISGADADSFDIVSTSGQITVGSGTSLDYESRNSYAVVVTAADPSGATDTIAVTINVTDVNESPTATDDTSTTEENTAVDINVVAIDTDPDSGTTLAVTVVSTAPGNGTAVIKSGSATTVTYTPNTDFNGQDSFTYTLSDGSATATGTVNVVVYTPAPTPSGTQSTRGVPVGAETKAEAPGGDVTVAFPQGASTGTPFQVRVDDAPNQDCGNLPSGQIVVGCSQVDLFKLDGEDWDTVDGTPFDSANLIISVSNTQDISVYRREDPSDSWTSIPQCEVGSTDEVECFTVSGGLVIIQNILDFSQFAVVRPRPSSQVVTLTETATPPPTVIPPPTPGGGGAATITRRRRGGSIVRATATPAPMVVATPAPTKMVVPATVASTAVPPTPELRAVVQPTAAPPTPAPTTMAAIATPTVAPASTDTPAAVAAIRNTPVPASTTALPPAAEAGGSFPAWLIVVIAAAVIIAGGLGFGAWRLLRPQ